MPAAPTDNSNDVVACEIERGNERCDLRIRSCGHRSIEDAGLVGMITKIRPDASGGELLNRGPSSVCGMLQFARRGPKHPSAHHADVGSHGLRMVAAHEAREFGVSPQPSACLEDADN